MGRFGFFIFLVFLFVLLDVYSFYGLKGLLSQGRYSRIYTGLYFAISAFGYFCIVHLYQFMSNGVSGTRSELFNFTSGFLLTLFITKLVFSIFLFTQDGGRAIIGLFQYVKSLFGDGEASQQTFIPERRTFITNVGAIVAAIPFFGMLYGITKGKYQYTVEKITLTFRDLPKAFDGFKLVQISDIHAGSFDNKDKVLEGILKINALDPDIVCFTGDLVNSEKEEIDPYIDIFGQIKAKYGKFAILGNHDYYGRYDKNDPKAIKTYHDDFGKKYAKMGFDLMKNESRSISIDGDKIHLLGVENWGAGRFFQKYGDIDLAAAKVPKDAFNIMLSHDPTHWDEKILNHERHMHLTLSGHTHGFQFGFQLPGYAWSPAKYRYKRWLGLYEEAEKFLYVNRGFGFLGFPGRIGMWPEITLIELRSDVVVG